MIEYDESILSRLNENCYYINELPIASCIIDLEKNIILKYNDFFADLFAVGQEGLIDLKKFTDFEFSSIIKEIESNKEKIFYTNTEIIQIEDINKNKIRATINFKLLRNFKNKIALAIFNNVFLNSSKDKLTNDYFIGSNEFIKSMFDDLPVLFYVMDLKTFDFLYVNKYTKEILCECNSENYHEKLGITEYEKRRENNENYSYEKTVSGIWYKMSDHNLWWFKERRVKISIGIDITQLKINEEKMLLETSVDSLTGAYSRIVSVNYIQNLAAKTKQESFKFSICYFGINNLKYISEKYSRKYSDEYIKTIADTVKKIIRKSDIFSRSSDDEFIIVLKECSIIAAERIMESVNKRMEDLSQDKKYIFKNPISYGIVEIDENNNNIEDADDIIDIAVKKMLEMKSQFQNYQ